MSDKKQAELWEVDRLLRQAHPVVGMCSMHTQVTIEKICGFELFNTRPYHNYETWSDGYRISAGEESGLMDYRHNRGGERLLVVQAEDLDDAVREYVAAVDLAREAMR